MLAGDPGQPLQAGARSLGDRLAGTELDLLALLVGGHLPLGVVAPWSAVL